MNNNYGVPRDIRAKVKLGMFFVLDIVIVFGTLMLSMMFAPKIFPAAQWKQGILFVILTISIAVYLLLPTNGGKKNWQSLIILIKRRKKRWISFDWHWEGKKK